MRTRILIGVSLTAVAVVPAADARTHVLRPFRSCPALVGYAQAHGAKAVGTGWVPPAAVGAPVQALPGRPIQAEGVAAPAPQTANGTADTGAGTQFSTTNVQEEGVDEPDVVKTDGKVIYAVADGHLYAIDARADTPKLLGSLQLAEGSGQEILLHGDRVLVLQNAWLPEPVPAPPPDAPAATKALAILRPFGRAVTRLTEVDVSDPSAMKVVSNERADGAYVSARRNGDTARVVLVSQPRIYLPIETVAAPTPAAAIRRRRGLVRHARLASWRPVSYFRRGGQAVGRLHPLVACQDVRHPLDFSGLDTVTVLTVDLSRGLPSIDSDAIMSDADIVYGSPKHLYVATRRWLSPQILQRPEPPPIDTQINAFDVSDPERTTYSGSGAVKGFLLNQFSLSEQDGVLRVASTEGPEWWEGGPPPDSQSYVSTLDASSSTLTQIGQVGDLGKGQKIFAVRFIGDVGYVVTFRQLDPLYTVGLSDPAHPKVLGSLELAGYSAYLHPIGRDLLLGVGQDAGTTGQRQGTQLSLFDVSDPAKPARLAKYTVGQGASSTAEFDHHAFLYWAPQKLAVIPVGVFGEDGSTFEGAIGFHVDRGSITEAGRVSHPAGDGGFVSPIQRSLVIGGRLYTLSDAGLLSSDLGSLAAGPWLAFPDAPSGGPIVYANGAPPPAGG